MISEDAKKHLHPTIVSNLEKLEKEGGITINKLKPGSKIVAKTRNTEYILEIIDPTKDIVLISGNQRFCPFPVRARLNGSTWGGSMIKIGFIGKDMHMEVVVLNSDDSYHSHFTTTAVQEATLIGPDNAWKFKLWE